MGRLSAEDEEHLRACSACNGEVSPLRNSISGLSQAIHEESERQLASLPRFHPAERRRQSRTQQITWAVAAAALVMAVALPLYQKNDMSREDAIADSDSGLLDEIDAQLSREVPASMQTLMELMQEDEE